MKVDNLRGDLTDISAKKKAPVGISDISSTIKTRVAGSCVVTASRLSNRCSGS